jgi:hypothetical protein
MKSRLDLKSFFRLFLLAAFPIHLWSLLMIFRDVEFLSERTNMWDAVGISGYTLLIALIESLLAALILLGVISILPGKWAEGQRFSIISSLYMILAGASIVDMAFHAFSKARISQQYLHGLETYPSLTYGLIAGAVLLFCVLVTGLILRSKKVENLLTEFYDRIMLLSYLYLALDMVGIALVIVRNINAQL